MSLIVFLIDHPRLLLLLRSLSLISLSLAIAFSLGSLSSGLPRRQLPEDYLNT